MLSGFFMFSVKGVKYAPKTKHLFLLKTAFLKGTFEQQYNNRTNIKIKNP